MAAIPAADDEAMTAPVGTPSRRRRTVTAIAVVATGAILLGGLGCASEAGPTAAVRDGDGAGRAEDAAPAGDGGSSTTDQVTTTERATSTTSTPATTTTTAPPTTTTAPPTTTTAPPTTTTTVPDPGADGRLELGESGESVAALQARLSELGYWLGEADGTYGQLTRQAVMAFQKAEGLGRDGVAGPDTEARLATAGRPTARSGSGSLIEIDLNRQILLVVQDGRVRWALNTSTGNGEAYASPSGGSAVAATPPGRFAIDRQIDGYRHAPLGTLYRPKYFNRGIAVHGAGSVPAQPASHGCARVTNAAMDLLWSSGVAEVGTTVWVY